MPGKDQVETTLADLGLSILTERIPECLDSLLGFELVASNDDKTRAAGIFGFMVGQELLYVPCLFLNGKVKGTEVLLIKKADTFTSNTKSWWKFLTSRSPGSLGEAGVMPPGTGGPTPASMRVFTQPPMIGGKIASLEELSQFPDIDQLPEWKGLKWNKQGSVVPDAYEMLNRWYKTSALNKLGKSTVREEFTISNVLKSMGKHAYLNFMDGLMQRPELFEKVASMYDMDDFKLSFVDEPKQQKVAECKLAVYNVNDLYANPDKFSVEEKEQIMTRGYAIWDKRAAEEKTPVYKEDYLSRFSEPKETGFYEIINRFGELKKVLVLVHPFLTEHPKSNYENYIILDEESGVFCTTREGDPVMVRTQYSGDDAVWKEKHGKLTSISGASINKYYCLVGPKMNISTPFKITSKSGSGKDVNLTIQTSYRFRNYRDCPGGLWDDETTVRIVDREDSDEISKVGSIVFIPKSWKVMEVDGDSEDYRYGYGAASCCSKPDSSDKPEKDHKKQRDIYRNITPGDGRTIDAAILNKNIFKLNINKQGSYYTSSILDCSSDSMKKAEMSQFLVTRIGMSESDADEFLSDVDSAQKNAVWVKLAYTPNDIYNPSTIYGGDALPPLDNQLGINNSGVMEVGPQSQIQQLDFNNPVAPNSDGFNLDDANWDKIKPYQQFLERAADSGSRSVFDPAMIGMLLRTSRSSAQVDQWLPDLVNALDEKCRLLLLFYWHNGDFASDYGKDEMAEFEDQLLNSIKVDGTLILFLKQKSGESSDSNIDAFEDQ